MIDPYSQALLVEQWATRRKPGHLPSWP